MGRMRKTFGDVAISKGYISAEILSKALERQVDERAYGRYPLLGITLLKMGAITSTQLIEIILEMETDTDNGK